jgi:hypothetical protein
MQKRARVQVRKNKLLCIRDGLLTICNQGDNVIVSSMMNQLFEHNMKERNIVWNKPIMIKNYLIKQRSCGLFLTFDGDLYECKNKNKNEKLIMKNVKKYLYGDGSYYALTFDGNLFVKGNNPFSRLVCLLLFYII